MQINEKGILTSSVNHFYRVTESIWTISETGDLIKKMDQETEFHSYDIVQARTEAISFHYRRNHKICSHSTTPGWEITHYLILDFVQQEKGYGESSYPLLGADEISTEEAVEMESLVFSEVYGLIL